MVKTRERKNGQQGQKQSKTKAGDDGDGKEGADSPQKILNAFKKKR